MCLLSECSLTSLDVGIAWEADRSLSNPVNIEMYCDFRSI